MMITSTNNSTNKSILLVISLSLVLSLVFVLSIPPALGIEYIDHDVKLLITQDMNTRVLETYQIKLNETEKDYFSQLMDSPNLKALVDLGTGPSFNATVNELHISHTLGEAGFAQVTLQYTSPDLVSEMETRGNKEIVGITENDLAFYDGSKVVFPFRPTTQLTIQFPENLKLAEQPQPNPTEERVLARVPGFQGQFYEYRWKGPFSSDRFRILFEVEKPIQTQFSISSILDEIRARFGNPLYIVALVIIIALLYIYRGFILNLLKDAFGEEPLVEEKEEK